MMTPYNRLVATIKGEKTDRIPVFCNLFDQGAKFLNMSVKDYYAKGENVAEAQIKMQQHFGQDNVWGLFYVGKSAEALGCRKILFSEQGPPNVEDFVIKSYEDIEKLVVPKDLFDSEALSEPFKAVQILRRELGGKVPICVYVTGAATLPAILMGMDKWFDLLFMGPKDLRNELLRKCNEYCVKEIQAYKSLGADVVLYANAFGSTDFVPKNFILSEILPWIKKDIEPSGPDGVVYYTGSSRLNPMVENIITEVGIVNFYPSPLEDHSETRKLVAGRGLAAGVINDVKLINWTETQVREEVKKIVEAGKPEGKFLFGTVVMPLEIPKSNIHTMIEAAKEYGHF